MSDPTEGVRRAATAAINTDPRTATRESLEAIYGADDVFDTTELQEQFTVVGFCAPGVGVRRKSDGVEGTLLFRHNPRYYFQFRPSG